MMHNVTMGLLLVFAPMVQLMAAPVGSFSGDFPNYTFTATCADPIGASVAFPGNACNQIGIDYMALGSTSLFANAQLMVETILIPGALPPFPFTGTFSLVNLDSPADTIMGTLAGQGFPTGAPGPPVGYPPFGISATLAATGGTGAYVGASGSSVLSGTAFFTSLSTDTTTAGGEGDITVEAVPEPSTALLSILGLFVCFRYRPS